MTKSKKSSQSGLPNVMRSSENSSSADFRKELSESVQSDVQVPVVNQVKLAIKVRSRRKIDLKKPQKDLKLPDKIPNDHSNPVIVSLHYRALNLEF